MRYETEDKNMHLPSLGKLTEGIIYTPIMLIDEEGGNHESWTIETMGAMNACK